MLSPIHEENNDAHSNSALRIGLSVLDIIGPNLYSNIYAVLSEMIANAWDADASEVKIEISLSRDLISIEDNGNGMSYKDLIDKFLFIGFRRRSAGNSTYTAYRNRHVMGRKGVGRISVFAFAKTLEIHTANENGKTGCILEWDDIQTAADNRKTTYQPKIIPSDEVAVERGTKIVLRNLFKEKIENLLNIKVLKRKLARRFTVLGRENNLDVKVNGESIADQDRPYLECIEFVWFLGDKNDSFLTKFKGLRREPTVLDQDIVIDGKKYVVKGWLGTTKQPSDLGKENNTIAIFAHGKLVHEDILAEFSEGGNFAPYIIGNIEADFLDDDNQPDIITSDRQSVNKNDTRYIILSKYIKSIVSQIGREWTTLRLERDASLAFIYPEIKGWYDKLNKTNKRTAASLLAKIAKWDGSETDKNILFRAIVDNFDALKDKTGITTLPIAQFIELLIHGKTTTNIGSGELEEKRVAIVNSRITEKNAPTTTADRNGTDTPDNQQKDHIKPNPEASPKENENKTLLDFSKSNQDNNATLINLESALDKELEEAGFTIPTHQDQDVKEIESRVSAPKDEIKRLFLEIRELIVQSKIEPQFKEMAKYDLIQAYRAYCNNAFKACTVMLGAVLEGMMLGTLRKPEVLKTLSNDPIPPKCYADITKTHGTHHPHMNNVISEKFTFENMRTTIEHLIPDIKELRSQDIQVFRNIVHPWIGIKEAKFMGKIEYDRAVLLLTTLKIVIQEIVLWSP